MSDAIPDFRGAYSPEQFQQAFSLSKSLFYALVKAGRLRAVKVGRRTLITRADADAFLASLPELNTTN